MTSRILQAVVVLLLSCCLLTATSRADYNYPEVKWLTTKTPHFVIHFHTGAEWTAAKAAHVAEKIYDELASKYARMPKRRIHIVINDLEDHANGFAVWNLNWITLWATNSRFSLRGRHDWIYGTLIHELSHIISLHNSAIAGSLIEGIHIGGLEDEDVDLNLDAGFSVFLANNPAPRWWAEAVAQLDTAQTKYDKWDTSQDMLLRMATLEDNLLSYDELHNISVRTHFGPELVYNQGFSFLSYLSERFGDDINKRITDNQRRRRRLNFEKNFKDVYKVPLRQLYKDWLQDIKQRYEKQTAAIAKQQVKGNKLQLLPEAESKPQSKTKAKTKNRSKKEEEKRKKREKKKAATKAYKDGLWNFQPSFSPQGHFFTYVNNNYIEAKLLERPYDLKQIEGSGAGRQETRQRPETSPGIQSGLQLGRQLEPMAEFTDSEQRVANDDKEEYVNDALELNLRFKGRYYTWSPDGNYLMLSWRRANAVGAYSNYDFYVVDFRSTRRLLKEYLWLSAKTANDDAQKKLRQIYEKRLKRVKHKTQRLSKRLRGIYPTWSADGRSIAFSRNHDGQMSLEVADIKTNDTGRIELGKPRALVNPGDGTQCLSPSWSPDGRYIAYFRLKNLGDAGGLWLYDYKQRKTWPIVDNLGDSRDPVWSQDGKSLYFSSDHSGIFQIYRYQRDTKTLSRITNVLGGAVTPYVDPVGKQLLYSYFTSFGFKIYQLGLKKGRGPSDKPVRKKALQTVKKNVPERYAPLKANPYILQLRPLRLFPTLVYEDRQAKVGASLQVSDYHERHNFNGAILLGQDQDYSLSYLNSSWYLDLWLSYSKFKRTSRSSVFIEDGDGIDDEPRTLTTFDFDFINAALSIDLVSEDFLRGDHRLWLGYSRRTVNTRVGIPALLNPTTLEVGTSFRDLTNNGVDFQWQYSYFRDRHQRRADINPRGGRNLSIRYAHVWTDLFAADQNLNPAVDNYDFNRVILDYNEYIAVAGTEASTVEINFTGGYIDRDVSSLDEFFAGGRLNFRAFGDINANSSFYGYEDFNISGETLLLLRTMYRFPVALDIAKKWHAFYFDSLFAGVFFEVGNAWDFGETKNCAQTNATGTIATCGDGNTLLQDVGAELRLKGFLFNDFNNWNSILRVAYGFQDNFRHGFTNEDLPVRFYLGFGTNF